MIKKKRERKSFADKLFFLVLGLLVFSGVVIVLLTNKSLNLCSNVSTPTSVVSNASALKLMSFVDSAKVLIEKDGVGAFSEFRKENGAWWKGDSYIYVYDMNGNTVVLPPAQNIEGTNRSDTKDANGNFYVRDMLSILKTKDYGWESYVYPKPGSTDSVQKLSYFKKVMINGVPYMVGSGIYLE